MRPASAEIRARACQPGPLEPPAKAARTAANAVRVTALTYRLVAMDVNIIFSLLGVRGVRSR